MGVGVVGLVRAVRIWERVERVAVEGGLLGMVLQTFGRTVLFQILKRNVWHVCLRVGSCASRQFA